MENEKEKFPVYQQMAQKVIEQIYTGVWKEGEALPTEKELGRLFGVSIGTVRKALRSLEDLGFVHKIQGSGTYIDQNFHMERRQKALYYTELLFSKCSAQGCSPEEMLRILGNFCGYPEGWHAKIRIGYVDTVWEDQQDMQVQLERESGVPVDLYRPEALEDAKCREKIRRRDKLLLVAERCYPEVQSKTEGQGMTVRPLKIALHDRCRQWISNIPKKDLLVILYETNAFLDEVCNLLYRMGIHKTNMFFSVEELAQIREVEWNRATCILPAFFLKTEELKTAEIVRYLIDQNCRLVPVIYNPEQAVRHQIQQILEEEKKDGNKIL
ncbi:MAG: GntR family transcriptional regulator [Eubacteriales bacterium]|nr:GntR family transcriptional regulator [Eubacteriales bacterium]